MSDGASGGTPGVRAGDSAVVAAVGRGIHRGALAALVAQLLLIAYVVMALLFPQLTSSLFSESDATYSLRLAVCAAALGLVFLLRLCGYAWVSAPVVMLCYLLVFHFALACLTSLNPGFWDVFPWFKSWSMVPSWYQALLYSLMCLLGFVAGCALARACRSPRRVRSVDNDEWENKPLYLTGMVVSVLGSLYILAVVALHGGLALLQQDYITILDTLTGAASKGIVMVSLGIPMAAAGASPNRIKLVLIYQAFISLFFLMLGTRSFALPVPIVLLVLMWKRGYRFSWWKAGLAILALLWVITFARLARDIGQGFSGLSRVSLSNVVPVDALIEMGGTLQTVSLACQWTDESGRFQWGGGYAYGFERLFRRRGGNGDRPDDERSLEAQMLSRAPGLGGSSIGESYYNFGLFGPLLYFLPLGLLLGLLDDRARSPRTAAVAAIALLLGIINGRGYFTGIPAYILYAVVCWMLQAPIRALFRRRSGAIGGVPAQ